MPVAPASCSFAPLSRMLPNWVSADAPEESKAVLPVWSSRVLAVAEVQPGS